jgi:hypothetical protein
MLEAYTQGLPGLTRVTANNLPVLDNAQLRLAQQNAPAWAQLQTQLAQQQGVPLAEASARAEAAANAIKSGADADILRTTGRDYATQLDALQRQVDPEYYETRANIGRQSNALLNSYDLNGLSPTERAEMERSLARQNTATGTYGNPSQINILANANQFGSALQNKRNNLSNSIGLVAGSTPSLKSGIDVAQGALGRPSMATGLANSQFAGVSQPNFGGSTLGMGNNLLGQTGENARQSNMINANRRDTLDRVNETMSAQPISC